MGFSKNILPISPKLRIENGYMYDLTANNKEYEIFNTSNNPYFQPWDNIFGTGVSPTFNGTSIGATLKLPDTNKIPLTLQLSGTNTSAWKIYFSEDGISFDEIYSGEAELYMYLIIQQEKSNILNFLHRNKSNER